MTVYFGGRDAGSGTYTGYFRVLVGASEVFTGSTSDLPFEAYTPLNPSDTTPGSVSKTPTATLGVAQKDREYFKNSFNVSAGTHYTLQVTLTGEQNFDFALGPNCTSTAGLVMVPEPGAAMLGLLAAAGLLMRRRRLF